jgi:hypothetical protein
VAYLKLVSVEQMILVKFALKTTTNVIEREKAAKDIEKPGFRQVFPGNKYLQVFNPIGFLLFLSSFDIQF